jgi:hypothetical protein
VTWEGLWYGFGGGWRRKGWFKIEEDELEDEENEVVE